MKTQISIILRKDASEYRFQKVIELEKAAVADKIKFFHLTYTVQDASTTINHVTDAQTQTISTYALTLMDTDNLDDIMQVFIDYGWSLAE